MVSCKQESPDVSRTLHRTGIAPLVPDTQHPATEPPETVHRTVRLRLYPGDAATGILLTAIAGACRHVWNHLLADHERRYRLWKAYRIGPKPVPTFFTLGRRFTQLRNDPDHAWLRDYPFACVRYSLKYLADAYKRYLKDPQTEGKPRFKARHFTVPAFTIPEAVKMDGDRLYVPKVGWLRLAGSNPYAGCQPLTVRVRREDTEQNPKWYAYVCYDVPAEHVKQPAPDGALGLDRNVGQATDSEGTVYALPDTDPLDANIKRKQRELSRKRGWGPQDKRPKSNRGRRVNGQLRKLHRKRQAQAGRCHPPGQPYPCGHGPYRGRGGPEHEGHDGQCQGHQGRAGDQRQGEGGSQPRHPGLRLGSAGAEARVQGGAGGQGRSGIHVTDLQPVWPCRQGQPAVAGGVCLSGLRLGPERRSQCGDQHFGAGGASVRARSGPGDRGCCTGRGDPVGDPCDP